MARHYSATAIWSDEDEAFVATSLEFPGLSGVNEDRDSALHELDEAIEMLIEDMEERGERVPNPEIIHEYSGQLRLRLTKDVHALAARQAERQSVSLNAYLSALIAQGLGRDEALDAVIHEIRGMQGWMRAVYEAVQNRIPPQLDSDTQDIALRSVNFPQESVNAQASSGNQHLRLVKA